MKAVTPVSVIFALVGIVEFSCGVVPRTQHPFAWFVCALLLSSAFVVFGLWAKAKIEDWLKKDSEENQTDTDSVLLLGALLMGVVGLLLVVTQIISDFSEVLAVEFRFEELLLGLSGSCMLWEEFRLLRSDKHTRDRAKEVLDAMESKGKDIAQKHVELTDRIDCVGPEVIAAVKAIFSDKGAAR